MHMHMHMHMHMPCVLRDATRAQTHAQTHAPVVDSPFTKAESAQPQGANPQKPSPCGVFGVSQECRAMASYQAAADHELSILPGGRLCWRIRILNVLLLLLSTCLSVCLSLSLCQCVRIICDAKVFCRRNHRDCPQASIGMVGGHYSSRYTP